MTIKKYLIWFILAGYIAIPEILWFQILPISNRFSDPIMTLTSLGQLAALLGMTIFTLNLIFAARLRFLEPFFNGLNRLYIDHHNLGGIVLSLLLFHPIFLASKYLYTSTYSAALFLLPDMQNISKTLGIFALILMIFALFGTYYLKLRYDIWKISHKLLALAYLIGFIHLLKIQSDVSRSLPLRYFMISITSIALIFIAIRVFNRILSPKLEYRLESIKISNNEIFHLILKPINSHLRYKPGQFVFASFFQNGFNDEEHPFSIVSGPDEANLELGIKMLGDHTAKFNQLKPGAKVTIDGPYGRFSPAFHPNKDQIWIAGGIGITPFISMARQIVSTDQNATLIWTVKNAQEAVFSNELSTLAAANKNLKFILFDSQTNGYLTAKYINDQIKLSSQDIYLCGPPIMMKSLRQQFNQLGINNDQIHSEEFAL